MFLLSRAYCNVNQPWSIHIFPPAWDSTKKVISYDIYLSLSYLLSMIICRSKHVAPSGIISLFYGWVILLCICVYVRTTSSLLIYLSMETGCFHVRAIVNSAAMNTGVHVPFWIRVFSGSPGVWLLNCMVILWLFKRLSSIVAAPSYSPAEGLGGSLPPHLP